MKTTKQAREVRYLTKKLLLEVAEEGDQIGFNQQIEPSVLPRITNEKMPVVAIMVHGHIAGNVAAPHFRCEVVVRVEGCADPQWALVDMTMERFWSLPVRANSA